MEKHGINTHDTWVEHPRGRIFTRRWLPASTNAGPPIALLHDSLGCVALWRTFPAALSAAIGREVIAYDRLGFGRSSPRHEKLGGNFIAEEADTLKLLAKEFGFPRAVLFGHSVGGGMALHCAARFPDLCAAVITESAQAFVEDRTGSGILAAKKQFREGGQLEKLRKYHGDKAEWVLASWTETWLSAEFAQWSLAPILPEVKCPLLVIHGAQDEYGSTRHPQMIAKLSTGPAQLAILPDTFHVPHREREEEVVKLVVGFLERI